ncbi:MAG: hypothetical protein C0432_04950 [Candidatus Puniceispirillum sp.]|nr:hypothetical protein [Candidatus Pelagibacter sp.]MBA4283622.1 hypothetical protein [Candidatus Puniceispirillum sp.]
MKNLNKLALICAVSASAVFASTPSSKGNFTGFYAGAGLGVVKKKVADQNNANGSEKISKTGASFSVFGGYGHQMNNLYLGAELAVKMDTAKPSKNTSPNQAVDSGVAGATRWATLGNVSYKSKESMIIAFAPRMGYVFDSLLVYLKPGFEYSKLSEELNVTGATGADEAASAIGTGTAFNAAFKSKKSAKFAFTPAVGAEYKLNKNLTTRMEYSYKQVSRNVNLSKDALTINLGKVKKVNHNLTLGVAYIF